VKRTHGIRRAERAQALLWLVMAVPLCLSMAGLTIDGGVLLDARRELQSAADGAARAGATRVDMQRLRDSAGTDVQLDSTGAAIAARTYLDQAFTTGSHAWREVPVTDVEVGQRRVQIQVRTQLHPAFLQILGIDNVPVEADAFADVQFGIRDGGGA
jgi:uncharacterized membrane protein